MITTSQSGTDLVAAAKALAPTIEAYRDQSERDRTTQRLAVSYRWYEHTGLHFLGMGLERS